MDYTVEISRVGRSGWVTYSEKSGKLSFGWDFSATGLEIYVPTAERWDLQCENNDAKWAKGRRKEILERIALEVKNQKAKNAKVRIEDQFVYLDF